MSNGEENQGEVKRDIRDITDPISLKEAAAIIGAPVRTVQDWCKLGDDNLLVCRKVGREWIISETSARNFIFPDRGRPPKS